MTVAICIASGPSLAESDCDIVRQSGLFTIVVNTTYQRCPWANILYAMDRTWWDHYYKDAIKRFKGRMICPIRVTHHKRIEHLRFDHGRSSGYGAITLAKSMGYKTIIMLGYDCQHTGDRAHWHADHPKPMGNAQRTKQWAKEFKRMSLRKDMNIINATRATALKCFERMSLEEAFEWVRRFA